jgi:hypothetical protein
MKRLAILSHLLEEPDVNLGPKTVYNGSEFCWFSPFAAGTFPDKTLTMYGSFF